MPICSRPRCFLARAGDQEQRDRALVRHVQFKSKLVGFSRAGELYDPLIFGETVGTLVGSTTFIPGKGIQLNNGQSYVKYLLPATVTNGEFSMDIEGLRANGPGDKAKVFGMQEGQDDFITNRYRVDIQYRGVTGAPPNAITFRALYGSADDLNVRYEPDTNTRFASVFQLNPANTYYWKATWGSEFRVVMKDGGSTGTGVNGIQMYNVGLASTKGQYAPNPHYAYLGAPVGRSGTEAASIPGTIYRNVWLGNKPRPESLGSALDRCLPAFGRSESESRRCVLSAGRWSMSPSDSCRGVSRGRADCAVEAPGIALVMPPGPSDGKLMADFNGDRTLTTPSPTSPALGSTFTIEFAVSGAPSYHVAFRSPHRFVTLSVADVDHDSDPDLVVSLPLTCSRVAVWLNDGHGRFSPADPRAFSGDGAKDSASLRLTPPDEPSLTLAPTKTTKTLPSTVSAAAPAVSIHRIPACSSRVTRDRVAAHALLRAPPSSVFPTA